MVLINRPDFLVPVTEHIASGTGGVIHEFEARVGREQAEKIVDKLSVKIVEVLVEGADDGFLGLDPGDSGEEIFEHIGHSLTLLSLA
jgi:hypothetical protein